MKKNILGLTIVELIVGMALIAVFFCDVRATYNNPDMSHTIPGNGFELLADKGFLYNESSVVSGSGEISIKGLFSDCSLDSNRWMKGNGSINFESLRNMNKFGRKSDFAQKSDLVFEGGRLKDRKSIELPFFENGIGASVNEWSDQSHVDKSENEILRSINHFNNAMAYSAALAFDGVWDIKNMRGWSLNMNRSEEFYSGSFQTQKRIEFDDSKK